MKKKIVLILLLFLVAPVMLRSLSLAKVTVKVVDENGSAVQNATVAIVFKYGHLVKDLVKKRTDDEGKCSFIARTPDGTLAGDVTKANFYSSAVHHAFFYKRLGIWRPWNRNIDVVLRPVLHPVPMYVRNRDFIIPATGKKVGLDLMAGDWVAPYGKGIRGDFIVEHRRKYKDIDNFDSVLIITFPGRHDGIQIVNEDTNEPFRTQSSYQLPRSAPEFGYQAALMEHISTGVFGFSSDTVGGGYIFRVRSESYPDGRFKRAMYGKIRGDLHFSPVTGANGKIRLHYFLNPDFSRNLEFNTKHNLSSQVLSNEKVDVP